MYLCNVHNLCFCVIQICKMHHLSSSRHRQRRGERKREREIRRERKRDTRHPFHSGSPGVSLALQSTHLASTRNPFACCVFSSLYFPALFSPFWKVGKVKTETEGNWGNWGYWEVQLTGYGGHTELRYCCCCWWLSKIDCQNLCEKEEGASPLDKEALALLGWLGKSWFCCICIVIGEHWG